MQISVVLSISESTELAARIERSFPGNYYTVSPTQWLIAANMTPKGIGDTLAINTGDCGKVMIAAITGRWGWHNKDLWDWIGLKEAQ